MLSFDDKELPAKVISLRPPEGETVPAFVDSPHSGYDYPAGFDPLVPIDDLRRVEDAYVDILFGDAPKHGIGLLSALFPRSFIDPNRAASDIDPDMIAGTWDGPLRPTEKSRMGHGLVWRSYPSDRPLYRDRLPVSEIRDRIENYWQPYHDCLRQQLDHLHALFGGVWHIDGHSMPTSSSPYVPGRPGARADFVLGDRDGTTCSAEFTRFIAANLTELGYAVRINDPYRGAELVKAYGKPALNRHSIQIEINRGLYMNEATMERSAGFDALRRDIGRLLEALAGYSSMRATGVMAAE